MLRGDSVGKKDTKLKIIPLGGLNEIGKNMTAIQYGDEIIVIDAGLAFPSEEMFGIDLVIPDYTFLKKNKEKIKGLVITHGHEDHIGSIPYVLKDIQVPIYGTRLTMGLIDNKLKEFKNADRVKKQVVKAGDRVQLGQFEIEFIQVGHSIPDAVALCVRTPVGNIFHTGDFKVDYTPIDGKMIDLGRIAEIGREGVLLLMADSTNVERPGYTMSESVVGKTFEDVFRNATGRIIVASFASNVHRIQQVIDAAIVNHRKIVISGRSMENVTRTAMDLGYLKVDEDMILDLRDIDRYPENEIVIITTGTQGEPMSALARMANMEHRSVEIVPGDLVILSSSPIPGNEKSVTKIINLLYERGAEVIYEALEKVHVSGHACREELKLIHRLVKPKYFMPVHGEYSHLKHHAQLAEELGMSRDDIFILANGSVLELSEDSAIKGKPVQSGLTLIDGIGVGEVGNIVLRDRKILSEDGLMVVVVGVRKKDFKILSGPEIISRGFVYVRESEELMLGAKEALQKVLDRAPEKKYRDWTSFKNDLRDALKNYLYQTTKRIPMILPIIMEVEDVNHESL